MARFYFDIHNDDITLDSEGIDCADADAAKDRATREIWNLAADAIQKSGRVRLSDRIVVKDNSRKAIADISFGAAIEIID